MPTTARLVAALIFAALGWLCADLYKPLVADNTPVGLFSPISAGFGLLVGWFFAGARLERGLGSGPGIGLTASALLVFWVLLTFSGYKMVLNSMRKFYDGPVEALQAMFGIAVDYARLAVTPEVIGALVVGGLVGGVITEWVARRWS